MGATATRASEIRRRRPATHDVRSGPLPEAGAYRVRFARVNTRPARDASFIGYTLLGIVYLVWLATVVNFDVWLGPLLYLLVLFNVTTAAMFFWIARTIWAPVHRPANFHRTVDALITTSSEQIAVVEQTIRGALTVQGVRRVHVLDDGGRRELAVLAEKLGASYHHRGSRAGAKAGNLNYGLKFTDAEALLILDADHIPAPNFLARTLGYLDDPRVAVVQTHQSYRNNSFLTRNTKRGKWTDQDLFYKCLQPAKNRWNAAYFVGTSAILRRRALDEIGGFATEKATEDVHTTVRMHARGWRSVFVPEILAVGLEVQSVRELYHQRRRWAAGAMGLLLRSPDSPLRARGLSMPQRLSYVFDLLGHQQGALQLAFQLLPIASGLTLTSFVRSGHPLVNVAIPGFVAMTWLLGTLHGGRSFHLLHTPSMLLATGFSNIAGLFSAFRGHESFRPARKVTGRNERSFVKLGLWAIALLALAAFVRDVAAILAGPSGDTGVAVGCMVFIALNLAILFDLLLPLNAYERGEQRKLRPARTRVTSAPGRRPAPRVRDVVPARHGIAGVLATGLPSPAFASASGGSIAAGRGTPTVWRPPLAHSPAPQPRSRTGRRAALTGLVAGTAAVMVILFTAYPRATSSGPVAPAPRGAAVTGRVQPLGDASLLPPAAASNLVLSVAELQRFPSGFALTFAAARIDQIPVGFAPTLLLAP